MPPDDTRIRADALFEGIRAGATSVGGGRRVRQGALESVLVKAAFRGKDAGVVDQDIDLLRQFRHGLVFARASRSRCCPTVPG